MVSKEKKENFQKFGVFFKLAFIGILSFKLSFAFSLLDMSKKREYVSQLPKNQTRYEAHPHPHQRT